MQARITDPDGFVAGKHGFPGLIDALAAFCERLAGTAFLTVDTEFMRERTYWPELCLVQLAGQHAKGSTSFYLFDEASAIPDKIWEVAEGGLTDRKSVV